MDVPICAKGDNSKMWKAIVIIVLFSIFAITFTATMININKSEKSINESVENVEVERNVNHDETKSYPKEKTLDLLSTYDENDLLIFSVPLQISNSKLEKQECVKIEGLKNKEVEDKINNDIQNRYAEIVNDLSLRDEVSSISTEYEYNEYSSANFANVVSISGKIIYKIGERYYTKTIGLNYELVSGNRLKLDDLFTKDFSAEDIIRLAIYKKQLESENEWDYESDYSEGEMFFNINTNTWQVKREYYEWDEEKLQNVLSHEEIVDYVPKYNDYEIKKLIQNIKNTDTFWFSTTSIFFQAENSYYVERVNDYGNTYNDYYGTVYEYWFKDVADRVVIYDKYLTVDSLFENNNIGRKNIVTCSEELHSPKEKVTIIKSINFMYDMIPFLNEYTYSYNNTNREVFQYSEVLINNINNKMQKVIEEYENIALNDKNKAYFLFVFPFDGTGAMSNFGDDTRVYFKSKLITCDIKDRDELLGELFSNIYRYPSLGFYGSLLYNVIDVNESHGEYGNLYAECESGQMEEKFYYYDLNTNELDTESYMPLLKKDNLRWEDLDYLNKKYNEIFARHGHDFKSQELKEYFSQFDWYKPIDGKVVSLDELSEIERRNAEIIREVINEKKM